MADGSQLATIDLAGRIESKALALPQVACPVVHTFAPGVYLREVRLPAGSLVVGHCHRHAHLNVMMEGRALLIGDDGHANEVCAPYQVITPPGRKVAQILEPTVWVNVYATDERDVETLESMLFDKSEAFTASELAPEPCHSDRADYCAMLVDIGMTAEQVAAIATEESDLIPLPWGSYKFGVFQSGIHGRGLFATAPIVPGEVIAPARIDGKRTPAGRYTNHSATPNAAMVAMPNGDVYLVSVSHIGGQLGGMHGQEITVDYRQAIAAGRGL